MSRKAIEAIIQLRNTVYVLVDKETGQLVNDETFTDYSAAEAAKFLFNTEQMQRRSDTKHGGKRPNQTGRPPKPKAEKLEYHVIGFTPEMWEEIQEYANREPVESCACVVRNAVSAYFNPR